MQPTIKKSFFSIFENIIIMFSIRFIFPIVIFYCIMLCFHITGIRYSGKNSHVLCQINGEHINLAIRRRFDNLKNTHVRANQSHPPMYA